MNASLPRSFWILPALVVLLLASCTTYQAYREVGNPAGGKTKVSEY